MSKRADRRRLDAGKESDLGSDEEMLDVLRRILAEQGGLSGLIIDEAEDAPSSSAYQSRFGNLIRAYQLVGYTPERDYRYIEINRVLRRMHPQVMADTVAGIESAQRDIRRRQRHATRIV